MTGKRTTQIGYEQYQPPGSILEKPGKRNLETHTKQNDQKSIRISADKIPDLRVLMNQFFGA
jgi:hypothetical protein